MSQIRVQAIHVLFLLEKCNCMTQLKQIHSQVVIRGLVLDVRLLNRLITVFCATSEGRDLDYFSKLLYNTESINGFCWNLAIRGYADGTDAQKAILLYKRMLKHGRSTPDNFTYPILFKVCARLSLNSTAFGILGHVQKLGFKSDVYVHNAVIHMLVSCRELELARKMFEEGPVRDVVSWNSIINGYVRNGKPYEALNLYQEMEMKGIKPDEVTMIGVISSCSQLKDSVRGEKFHQMIKKNGLNMTTRLTNALMDMYVKSGNIEAAESLFAGLKNKTSFSWTTMIAGYAKLGFLDTAWRLFNEMSGKDVVPWNAIISSYAQAGRGREALSLFQDMQACNVKPDEVTMINCLSACSQLGALDVGIWIHHYVEKHNLTLTFALGTALVDMYAKCGNITKAVQVFREIPRRNSFTWTAIICGLASHGHAHDAISLFSNVIEMELVPDEITFLGVLSACCHGGLVGLGREYFHQMSSKFNITASHKHYSCMVDLLGRAGFLEEAEELIRGMPMKADVSVWGALLFACRIHGNILRGERAAAKLLELEPHDSGTYVLLANMYRDADMWEESRRVWKIMDERGEEKNPGCSSIEVNGVVNEFIIRDSSHPLSKQIYECLSSLTSQMELV